MTGFHITGAAGAVVDLPERQSRSAGFLTEAALVRVRLAVAAANRFEFQAALFPAATGRLSRTVQLADLRLHALHVSARIWKINSRIDVRLEHIYSIAHARETSSGG